TISTVALLGIYNLKKLSRLLPQSYIRIFLLYSFYLSSSLPPSFLFFFFLFSFLSFFFLFFSSSSSTIFLFLTLISSETLSLRSPPLVHAFMAFRYNK